MYKQIQRYLILAAGIITAGSLAAPAQAQYYKGKTITLLVGYSPGSGVTLSGRTFAPYWEKAIPGNPTVIVKNLTGGGGSKAQNFIYEKARPDGLTIYWGPTAMLGQIVGSPGIRARYDKLPFIGGSGRTLINYVATKPTNGLKKASDIAKVSKPLRLACTRSTSNFCILHRMAFDLLGVPYRIVAGFRGSEQFVKAMLQDEIDSHTTPDHSWNTGIGPNVKRDGKGKGVFFYPRIDANGNPEPLKEYMGLPNFLDVYKEVKGGTPSGPKWDAMKWILTYAGKMVIGAYGPPGLPKNLIEILRKSYKEVSLNKAYLASYDKTFGTPLNFIEVPAAEKFLAALPHADPEFVKLMKKVGTRKRRSKKK